MSSSDFKIDWASDMFGVRNPGRFPNPARCFQAMKILRSCKTKLWAAGFSLLLIQLDDSVAKAQTSTFNDFSSHHRNESYAETNPTVHSKKRSDDSSDSEKWKPFQPLQVQWNLETSPDFVRFIPRTGSLQESAPPAQRLKPANSQTEDVAPAFVKSVSQASAAPTMDQEYVGSVMPQPSPMDSKFTLDQSTLDQSTHDDWQSSTHQNEQALVANENKGISPNKEDSRITSDSAIPDLALISPVSLTKPKIVSATEAAAPSEATATSNQESLLGEFVRVMSWTLVAVIFGIIVAYTLKKLPQFKTQVVNGRRMKLIESLSLGRTQSLNIVQASGERFLVASDASGIKSVTILPPMDEPDLTEDQVNHVRPNPPETSPFTNRFESFLVKLSKSA